MSIDLSLTNDNIKAFFESKTQIPPVWEFLYVHTHRVPDDFISQVDGIILEAAAIIMQDMKYKGVVSRLHELTVQLGKHLTVIDEESAPHILITLRQIYQICKTVIG